MDKSAFRNRMQLYKLARELNPLLKYYDWKKENDLLYQLYKLNLPSNLRQETDSYNLYGAYQSNMKPELNEDGSYHLGSRNPETGEILKNSNHPTYLIAIEAERAAGYFPYLKNGKTYTKTYSPVDISGYADGGEVDDTWNPRINIEGYDDKGYYAQAVNLMPEIIVYGNKNIKQSEINRTHTEVPYYGYSSENTQVLPGNGALEIVSPEFDILTMAPALKGIGKGLSTAIKLATYKKGYTGVPHNYLKDSGKYMDEFFPEYNGTIWTSSSPDYARSFARDSGKIYEVYGKTKNLLDTPKAISKNSAYSWNDLPFIKSDGKVIIDKNHYVKNTNFLGKNKEYYPIDIYSKHNRFLPDVNDLKTDDIVNYSKELNKKGTMFHNISDGMSTNSDGNLFDEAIDEIIYNSGEDLLKLPYNSSKFKYIINSTGKPQSVTGLNTGYNIINNNKKNIEEYSDGTSSVEGDLPDYKKQALLNFERNLYLNDLNTTDPYIHEKNPFYNRVEDTYGTVLLPEVTTTAPLTRQGALAQLAKKGREAYYEGAKTAFKVAAPIVGGAALGAMTSAGLMSAAINPLDIASIAIDPLDPVNYLPFGLLGAKYVGKGIDKLAELDKYARKYEKYSWANHPRIDDVQKAIVTKTLARDFPHLKPTIEVPMYDADLIEKTAANYRATVTNNFLDWTPLVDLLDTKYRYSDLDRQQLYRIFNEDPRYRDYIQSNPDLNPLDLNVVNAYLDKLFTGIRGVSFSEDVSDELVTKALLENTEGHHGGDRLGTNSTGVYTSNSKEIADRFSRPMSGNSGRSDVAIVNYPHDIDLLLSIREQLALARRKIFNTDVVTGYPDEIDYKELAKQGYIAKESQYTTRQGNKLPGYERAYFDEESNKQLLNVKDLLTVKGLENKRGRWGFGLVESYPEIEDMLFEGNNIGNSYGDFIKYFKTLKSQKTLRRNNEYEILKDGLTRLVSLLLEPQFDKMKALLDKFIYKNPYAKSYATYDVIKNRALPSMSIASVPTIGIGYVIKDRNKKWESLKDIYDLIWQAKNMWLTTEQRERIIKIGSEEGPSSARILLENFRLLHEQEKSK